jgi:hypothetical protein
VIRLTDKKESAFSFLDKVDKRMESPSLLKKVGAITGGLGGLVFGGPIISVGKLIGSEDIVDIGKMAAEQTSETGALLGQVAEGLFSTASGLVQQDHEKINSGLNDLGDSALTVGSGIKNGVVSTLNNGMNVYEGLRDGNSEQAINGAKQIGKGVVAGLIGFGIADAAGVFGDNPGDHPGGHLAQYNIHLNDTHTALEGVGHDHPPIEHPGLIENNPDLVQAQSHVDPHYVDGYDKADGTHVDGYWRGGQEGYDTTNM